MVLKRLLLSYTWETFALHFLCSGLLGASFESIQLFQWQDGLEKAMHQWPWGKSHLCTLIVQVCGRQSIQLFFGKTELWVETIVLVTVWSWKGQSKWSWECLSTAHSLFRSPVKQTFELFSQETKLQISMMILVTRWSWKGCLSVTVGKTVLWTFIIQVVRRQCFKSIWSFYWEEGLVKFISHRPWECLGSAYSLFRSPGEQSFKLLS